MMPKKSLSAVLTAYRQPLELREIDVPEVEPNAALVAIDAATMCGTDVHIHSGELDFNSRLPVIMGHEAVGHIVGLGRNRTHDAAGRALAEGDRVVWSYGWCGACYWCNISRQPTLCPKAIRYGWGPATNYPYLNGDFAEYVYVQERSPLLKVPDGLDSAVVASSTCAFRTVINAFEKLDGVEQHETVVIQGTGNVGLYALAYSIEAGAAQVIAFGAPAGRLAVADRWGATSTYDVMATTPEERLEAVMAVTDGRGADLVVECSGAAVALEEGISLLRKGGKYLVIGPSDAKPAKIVGTDLNFKELTLIGSRSGAAAHFYKAIDFLARHGDRYSFGDLLGERFGLDGVNDALEAMRQGQMKSVILPHRPN